MKREGNTRQFFIAYGKYIGILAIFIAVGCVLLYLTYKTVRKEMIENLNAQQMIHAKQAVRGIETFFGELVAGLEDMAKNEHIVTLDKTGKIRMREFYSSHAGKTGIITRIDSRGRILYSEPYDPKVIGLSVTQVKDFEEVRRTGRITVSDVFTSLRGFKTIMVHAPVFKRGAFDGTISILFPADFIAKRYVEDIHIGPDGYAWIISKSGIELSCPVPGHVGNSVFDNCRDFPDILAIAGKMTLGEQGVATYEFDRVRGDVVSRITKQAVFMPIHLGNTLWSIVVATPEDEVLGALHGFRNRLMLIAVFIVIGMGFFFYVLFRTRILAAEVERRRRTEEALRTSQLQLSEAMDLAHIVYWEADPETRTFLFNDSFYAFCGTTAEREGGYRMAGPEYMKGFIHPDDWPIYYKVVEESFGNKSPESLMVMEHHLIRRDGEVRHVQTRARIFRDAAGKMLRVYGANQDVTERKRAEEEKVHLESQLLQAQKMEAIGTLAGGIAHDFNNMLMGIQGYTSLMLLDIDPSHPHYERLRSIEAQIRSGADLTRQLLGFARGGRYEIKPTDLNEIIKKTTAMFGRTKKEITIHCKFGSDLWTVEADQGQIEQVLLNLYVNAWQAMPGGGEIYVETMNMEIDPTYGKNFSIMPGRYVRISLTDTGVGMDEKTKGRIFEPFFTTKGMGRGTGLGLAMVYGIIKGHQGIINVYSEKGHGSTFNIYLPASGKEVTGEKESLSEPIRGKETILVIDDEEIILTVTKELLGRLGYQVITAGSGREGLDLYRSKRGEIALVLLDMIMPGMSGAETFEQLKSLDPEVKVILASGYSINEAAAGMLDKGCKAFIQKPFRIGELSQKIRSVLDG
ncbi:MAG: response regulator [Syntrophales bacterium]|nr:response regulator [Syntrophales bacterium]